MILFVVSTVFTRDDVPELFKYNQSTFQSFYFFKEVLIDTSFIAGDDWVGTFNCKKWDADSTACLIYGKCVGNRKYDRTRCGGGICDLPAMGDALDGSSATLGYLKKGEYPAFLIYDSSVGIYYRTHAKGDVKRQKDICRNGYPYCYEWKNQSFPFSSKLIGTEIYLDCMGNLGGDKKLDDCGICGGSGPQFKCSSTGISYCSEYKLQQECISN